MSSDEEFPSDDFLSKLNMGTTRILLLPPTSTLLLLPPTLDGRFRSC
jgi:hypothetical protein